MGIYEEIVKLRQEGRRGAVATIVNVRGSIPSLEAEKPRTLTFNLNENPKYDTGLVCGGTLDIFIEPVLPPALLYVFGAGHVSVNLYKVARGAGFDVTVVDDRSAYASRERFPDAKEVIAEDFEQAMAKITPQ